jgi:hypothetical protein
MVYVLTNPDLGWDCVIGAYSTLRAAYEDYIDGVDEDEDELPTKITDANIRKYFKSQGLILHKTELK